MKSKNNFHDKCMPKKYCKPVSSVDRDLARKRQIESKIEECKCFLMGYVAPSNRCMFTLMFDNWIRVPPWVGPTVQEMDRDKERNKKAFQRMRERERRSLLAPVPPIKGDDDGFKKPCTKETCKPTNPNQGPYKMKPCSRCK